ncbi:MAG TPA: NADH-quinone oxidoreductase subunit J [Blastocatellia bacterium]|nr:NADH-quinone oxidoreductase subunit J [Blastocatellia bacterium]
MDFQQILFLGLASLTVVAAFSVILQRNPIYSALGLIVVLCSLSGVFLLLAAQFIAVVQVIVYAGAIMVLFVFVIMLLNVREEDARTDRLKYLKWLAAPLFLALLGEVFVVVRFVNKAAPAIPSPNAVGVNPGDSLGTVESIANGMFTTYVFPFEAASVLILMAIVGAMFLARRHRKEDIERIEEALASQPEAQSSPKTKEEVAA